MEGCKGTLGPSSALTWVGDTNVGTLENSWSYTFELCCHYVVLCFKNNSIRKVTNREKMLLQ